LHTELKHFDFLGVSDRQKLKNFKIQDNGGRHFEKPQNREITTAVRFRKNLAQWRSSALLTVPTIKMPS